MTPTERVRQEMEEFRKAMPELLKEHAGQWVVFFSGKPIDFYVDEASAYESAMKRFGPGAGFVVARIVPEQPQPTSFALLFGVAE